MDSVGLVALVGSDHNGQCQEGENSSQEYCWEGENKSQEYWCSCYPLRRWQMLKIACCRPSLKCLFCCHHSICDVFVIHLLKLLSLL